MQARRTTATWMAAIAAAAAAVLAAAAARAENALLRSGTEVLLALEHHVSSAYTPAGADVRFRVAEDVVADGRVVIRGGTPVDGRMRQAADRAMLGTSGSMTLGVDFVSAVDGQQIRVVATETRRGRDRGNALAGWTIFWGLPGLVTQGVHPYRLRGSVMSAQVLFDRRIAPAASGPAADAPRAPVAARITGHRFAPSRGDPYRLDLEKERDLGHVEFTVDWPAAAAGGWEAALVAVDDQALAEPVAAASAADGRMRFDSWSILRYCGDGTTALRFRATAGDGAVEIEYPVAVRLSGSG